MKHARSAVISRKPMPLQWFGLVVGLLLMALFAIPAHAADEQDPPDRVGRLAELNGQVWIFSTDTNEWIAAQRNRPVTTGDRISTEGDGRAEVRIGSTVLRVAPNTEVEVLRLDDERVNLLLTGGSVAARLRSREAADEFSLQTAEGHFRTERAGSYRFDRNDDTSTVTALSGQASYENDGTGLTVQQGQRVEFWKERGAPQYSITDPKRDEFSNWVASLEGRDDRGVSTRYVSAEMTGVEDLDRYGRWEGETEYGAVWIPRTVVAGWAPYRMGHWAWIRPWGWTWVDDAPWGFAPFHYGRWVWYRNAWCWAPGRYVARPVYAPAMVAWMGSPGVSVSVSVGRGPTVGWFPLGPREVFVPGYRTSPRYVQNVNVTHVTNITNVTTIINNPGQAMAQQRYANRGQPRAVTIVPAQVVERRQPVAPSFSPVSDRQLRDFNRGGPRPQAPVAAPPRPPEARPVVDPRTSRPGAPRFAPGREAGGGGPGREAGGPPPANAARPMPGRDDRRDDRRDDDRRDPRDRNGDGRPDAPVTTTRPTPPTSGNRGEVQQPPARVESPAPVTRVPPPVVRDGDRAPGRAPDRNPDRSFDRTTPERSFERGPDPSRGERQHRHENPSPPQPRVAPPQQAQPQPQPQVQAPPPQVVRPQPAPPRPVVREAPPEPRQPQPREREREREPRADRGERQERGERSR